MVKSNFGAEEMIITAVAVTSECLRPFFRAKSGSAIQKVRLLLLTRRNLKRVATYTGFREQVLMLAEVLNVSAPGVVVECGCCNGGATVNLSLACRLAKRELYVFDSFAGLPEPRASDKVHQVPVLGEQHIYSRGAFACGLEVVQDTVKRLGAPEVCRFFPGYFEQTLPHFNRPIAFVYCDVDLRTSEETVVRHLWPLLQEGCCFFTHEAHHLEIASVFYDEEIWGASAPGLIGGGAGLGLYPNKRGFLGSCIGYAIKAPALTDSIQDCSRC